MKIFLLKRVDDTFNVFYRQIENDPPAAIHVEKWFLQCFYSSNVIDLTEWNFTCAKYVYERNNFVRKKRASNNVANWFFRPLFDRKILWIFLLYIMNFYKVKEKEWNKFFSFGNFANWWPFFGLQRWVVKNRSLNSRNRVSTHFFIGALLQRDRRLVSLAMLKKIPGSPVLLNTLFVYRFPETHKWVII